MPQPCVAARERNPSPLRMVVPAEDWHGNDSEERHNEWHSFIHRIHLNVSRIEVIGDAKVIICEFLIEKDNLTKSHMYHPISDYFSNE